jgi:hypothetical protein
MSGIGSKIAETSAECLREINSSALFSVAEKLRAHGTYESVLRSVLASSNHEQALLMLAAKVGQTPAQYGDGTFVLSRILLAGVALENLKRLEGLPLETSVKSMLCDYCKFFVSPAPGEMQLFDPKQHSFSSLAKIALLERFPAGQFDWEITGFPRSWLLKIPPFSLPKVAYFLARELKGFAPCIMPHVAYRRLNPLTRECEKSWYRMAISVEQQPEIRGFVGCSWIFSPDTFKVSPHLFLLVKPCQESGGLVMRRGKVHGTGFMAGSETRRKLYESGEFKPTMGLMLWTRDQMIQWAHSHPELGDA